MRHFFQVGILFCFHSFIVFFDWFLYTVALCKTIFIYLFSLYQVRNEKAEDFLALLREWETLCRKFSLIDCDNSSSDERESCVEDEDYCDEEGTAIPCGEYEVGRIVGICYGDPSNIGNVGLKFKVWKMKNFWHVGAPVQCLIVIPS